LNIYEAFVASHSSGPVSMISDGLKSTRVWHWNKFSAGCHAFKSCYENGTVNRAWQQAMPRSTKDGLIKNISSNGCMAYL